jgi:hypothetical protein
VKILHGVRARPNFMRVASIMHVGDEEDKLVKPVLSSIEGFV